jgi:hypothetical protein
MKALLHTLAIARTCGEVTFSAVFFDLILDLLPFIERAQPGTLNSGDVNKHVPAATALRLNESIAFGRIEPLHSAACQRYGMSLPPPNVIPA